MKAGLAARPRRGAAAAATRTHVTLTSTLVAGNRAATAGHDISGPVLAASAYNLIGVGSGASGLTGGINGNRVGTAASSINPLLGPLHDNGGPTPTMALLAGSPALSTGDPAHLGGADQRGVARSGGVNVGAYQASVSAFALTAPATATAGTPFDVAVTAVDMFGQTALGYTGTVSFSTTDPDPGVVLPPDYPFTAADQGTHAFRGGFALMAPGPWTLTATDAAGGFSASVPITVTSGGGGAAASPPTPPVLPMTLRSSIGSSLHGGENWRGLGSRALLAKARTAASGTGRAGWPMPAGRPSSATTAPPPATTTCSVASCRAEALPRRLALGSLGRGAATQPQQADQANHSQRGQAARPEQSGQERSLPPHGAVAPFTETRAGTVSFG